MAGLALMRGEKRDVPRSTREDLLATVRGILDPHDLETFRQYQEELPERMLRQQYGLQLGMMAPGLSEEARQRTLDVMVEHMLANTEQMMESGDPLAGFAEARTQMEAAAAQLTEELSEQDAAIVQGFFDQQLMGLEMVAGMMGEDETSDAPQEETAE